MDSLDGSREQSTGHGPHGIFVEVGFGGGMSRSSPCLSRGDKTVDECVDDNCALVCLSVFDQARE